MGAPEQRFERLCLAGITTAGHALSKRWAGRGPRASASRTRLTFQFVPQLIQIRYVGFAGAAGTKADGSQPQRKHKGARETVHGDPHLHSR